ncbi:maleylpyruvate isomerase N-terminal domain-containing protein, partial [Streptomyces coelicoflavus]|uniref:maleylpyruvate isomerase N-terminal domain-containing protein n=2 Tax=Streptomyces TaxID=1883 RepID=UPI0036A144B9
DFGQLKEVCLETLAAAARAAAEAAPDRPVRTQGHVLTAGDLMTTLAVEATVHHLDLTVGLPDAPGPSATGLAAVRATLDGLLGRPVPYDWGDEHYARAATGRTALTSAERRALGADAARFPLFS